MDKNRRKSGMLVILAAVFFCMPLFAPRTALAAEMSGQHDSRLQKFDIAPGDLSPAFDPDVLSYTATVDADVTSVQVQAVPRNSGGTIASVDGAKTLQPGLNTITVICSAPDGSYTTYTIQLSVGDAGVQDSAAGTEGSADGTAAGDTSADSGDTSAEPSASGLTAPLGEDGTVSLGGASYQLSGNFSYDSVTQDIPSAFVQGTLEIAGSSYPTLFCESNGVHLVYLENTDGNGASGFYFYDDMQNTVERFKYTSSGDNFVIFINTARDAAPAGYVETTLRLPSGKDVTAYQATSEDMKDYYVIYGINSDGTNGWYLYDNAQGAYIRYVQTAQDGASESEEEEDEMERTVSMKKYNSLYKQLNTARRNHVKVVSVMAIVIVGIIIIFTALLLRGSDAGDGENGGQDEKERRRAGKRQNRAKKQSAARQQGRTLAAGKAFAEDISDKSEKDARKTARRNRLAKSLKPLERSRRPEPAKEDAAQEERTPNMDDIYRQNGRTPEPEGTAPSAYRQAPPEINAGAAYRQPEQPSAGKNISTPEEIREQLSHASARRSILGSQYAGSEDSVQLAAQRMRQSMQRVQRTPEPAQDPEMYAPKRMMSEENRQAVFRPTKRINLDEAQNDRGAESDWEAEEAAAARKRTRKRKNSLLDENMEIMDLDDL